jgi:hypothetical protein
MVGIGDLGCDHCALPLALRSSSAFPNCIGDWDGGDDRAATGATAVGLLGWAFAARHGSSSWRQS